MRAKGEKRIPMYFSDALHLQSSDCRLWFSYEAIAAALSPTGLGRLNPCIYGSCSHASGLSIFSDTHF